MRDERIGRCGWAAIQDLHVIQSEKSREENDGDLHAIEQCLHIESRRIFFFVEEERDREKHALRIKEDADDREGRNCLMQKIFVVHPTEIRNAPGC